MDFHNTGDDHDFTAMVAQLPPAALGPVNDLLTVIGHDRDAPGDIDAAIAAMAAMRRLSPAMRPIIAQLIAAKFSK